MSDIDFERASTNNQPNAGFFDLFKIGIGPSSSHTIGPMRAAAAFARRVIEFPASVARIRITAYGSLAWTGVGHGTDRAILLGLTGLQPDLVDPDKTDEICSEIRLSGKISIYRERVIEFIPARDIVFDKEVIPTRHPNTMKFECLDANSETLFSDVWYSVGGGFVERDGDQRAEPSHSVSVPFVYRNAGELLQLSTSERLPIHEIVLRNELAARTRSKISE